MTQVDVHNGYGVNISQFTNEVINCKHANVKRAFQAVTSGGIASIADIEVEDLAFDKVRLYIGDEDSNYEMLLLIEDETPVGNGRNSIPMFSKETAKDKITIAWFDICKKAQKELKLTDKEYDELYALGKMQIDDGCDYCHNDYFDLYE